MTSRLDTMGPGGGFRRTRWMLRVGLGEMFIVAAFNVMPAGYIPEWIEDAAAVREMASRLNQLRLFARRQAEAMNGSGENDWGDSRPPTGDDWNELYQEVVSDVAAEE